MFSLNQHYAKLIISILILEFFWFTFTHPFTFFYMCLMKYLNTELPFHSTKWMYLTKNYSRCIYNNIAIVLFFFSWIVTFDISFIFYLWENISYSVFECAVLPIFLISHSTHYGSLCLFPPVLHFSGSYWCLFFYFSVFWWLWKVGSAGLLVV